MPAPRTETMPQGGSTWRTPAVVIACGCLTALLTFGVRASFGLFTEPLSASHGWGREVFALAIAIQNLMWGLGGSFLGAMADKYGSMRTLLLGALLYVIGFLGMAWAESGAALSLSAGVVMGIAIGGTSFGIILATLGRIVPAEQRSMAFGIGVAAARPFLGLPAGVVDGGCGFVGLHAAAPMRGSSISRSLLRLRNRWLLMVPSASPVMVAISPIGSSSR